MRIKPAWWAQTRLNTIFVSIFEISRRSECSSDAPLAGALAELAGAAVPNRLVRHDGGLVDVSFAGRKLPMTLLGVKSGSRSVGVVCWMGNEKDARKCRICWSAPQYAHFANALALDTRTKSFSWRVGAFVCASKRWILRLRGRPTHLWTNAGQHFHSELFLS